jgi:putative DNA primase/helicase
MSDLPMREIPDKSAAPLELTPQNAAEDDEVLQTELKDLRKRRRAADRANRAEGLNADALRYLQFVLRWLGFRGVSVGMVFQGQWESEGGEREGWCFVDAMSGAWENTRVDDISGPDITGLVAYRLKMQRLAAARRLKRFLRALKAKNGMERHCDLDPNATVFSHILWPIPEPRPAAPISLGWLGVPNRSYSLCGPDKWLAGYALDFDDYSWGVGPHGQGRTLTIIVTQWEAEDGQRYWRTAAIGRPLPLYGCEQLADNPAAPVVFTQGERSAEAAASFFERCIPGVLGVGLISIPGALERTPLHYLAGRKVFLLPNSGADGDAFLKSATELLGALTPPANVETIKIVKTDLPKSFIDHFEDSEPTDFSTDGWSFAHYFNAYEYGIGFDVTISGLPATSPTFGELRSLASEHTPETRKSIQVGDFVVDSTGLYVEKYKDGESKREWIASPIYVMALARTPGSVDWGVCLEFWDQDKIYHMWCMPRELLGGDPAIFCKVLLNMGATVTPRRPLREDLVRYILDSVPSARALSVTRPGWHGDRYVFPNGTSVGAGAERIVLQTPNPLANKSFAVQGTLQEWQDLIGRRCAGNSRLIIAICVAMAGALLHWLGEENGGIHIRGSSSIGKTTILFVACSVMGDPTGLILRWRSTPNGLEGTASASNDGCMFLDEISEMDPRELGNAIYMLANGQGKIRADVSGAARPVVNWRIAILSSGETGARQHMESVGGKAMAGHETRLIDVEADAGAGLGIFENAHGFEDGAAFSLYLKQVSSEVHGAPFRALVELLSDPVRRAKILASLRLRIKEFLAQDVPNGSDPQVHRVGRRFALYAAVGEVLIEQGIMPWDAGEGYAAARTCFQSWIQGRGGIGSMESDDAITRLRRFIEQFGESRFTEIGVLGVESTVGNIRTNDRAGFRKIAEDGLTDFYIFPEAYKAEICKGTSAKSVTKILLNLGALVVGSDGKPQIAKRLPGMGIMKVYHVRSSVLSDLPNRAG